MPGLPGGEHMGFDPVAAQADDCAAQGALFVHAAGVDAQGAADAGGTFAFMDVSKQAKQRLGFFDGSPHGGAATGTSELPAKRGRRSAVISGA